MALGTGGQHGSAICERKEARLLQVNVGMKMLSEDKGMEFSSGRSRFESMRESGWLVDYSASHPVID